MRAALPTKAQRKALKRALRDIRSVYGKFHAQQIELLLIQIDVNRVA